MKDYFEEAVFFGGIAISFGIALIVAIGIIDGNKIKYQDDSAAQVEVYQTDIIRRGYGLYCPTTGIFAFKGECNE